MFYVSSNYVLNIKLDSNFFVNFLNLLNSKVVSNYFSPKCPTWVPSHKNWFIQNYSIMKKRNFSCFHCETSAEIKPSHYTVIIEQQPYKVTYLNLNIPQQF